MPRGTKVVAFALVAFALASCGSSGGKDANAPVCTAKTEACRLERVAKQTRDYEDAGASHRDAACLAEVMSRVTPPKGKGTSLVIANDSISRSMDRCHIRQSSLDKISRWVDAKLRAAHEGPYARSTSSSP